MMEAEVENCGPITLLTILLGKWPTSKAVHRPAHLEDTCPLSLATPSILMLLMEAQVENCGLTIPPTIPLGKWPTSAPPGATAILEH